MMYQDSGRDVNPAHVAAYAASRLLAPGPTERRPGDFGKRVRTIKEVQQAFAEQRPAHVGSRPTGYSSTGGWINSSLASDGVSLWSYGWYEIARWIPGLGATFTNGGSLCIVRMGKMYSPTTTAHRSGVAARPVFNASCETPQFTGAMQL